MKRIAIDMDEVIADFNTKLIPGFNRRFTTRISLSDLEGLTIQQVRSEPSFNGWPNISPLSAQ